MSHPRLWYTTKVKKPANEAVNTGLHSCPTGRLIHLYGPPRHTLTDKCQPVVNPTWKKYMVTMDVGPFKATGCKLFLDVLKVAFAELKQVDPVLYDLLGSAGCLCCRRVRGSKSTLSNHGLGLAIDITIDDVLDNRGDNEVLNGLFVLYSILKKYKIWWGTEFSTEDAMHFEASAELVNDWIRQGKLVA